MLGILQFQLHLLNSKGYSPRRCCLSYSNAFELWCWRRLLRVPWTARRSNQSILKEISAGCSLVGLMLKLKLEYFGHLMQRANSFERLWCWERLRAGGEGVDRGWDGWMTSLTRGTWVWVNSKSWRWTGRPRVLQSMGLQRVRQNGATELNLKFYVWSNTFRTKYHTDPIVYICETF